MIVFFSFFLIQQFITQCVVVDHNSYFITTYKKSTLIWGIETREKKKRKKETNCMNKMKWNENRKKKN